MTKTKNSATYRALLRKSFLILLLVVEAVICISCSKQKEKPDILLVTIDTLRRDHLGIYGYARETSPFIDHLGKQGFVFKHVITPVAITSGSHASILSSLHPLTHQCIKNGSSLSPKVQTIAEVLHKNGYYTIGTVGVNFLSKQNGFDQGFDSFSGSKKAKRSAQDVNENLFHLIDQFHAGNQDKPFFIWVHYYDPHWPYLDREYTFQEKLPGRYDFHTPQYLEKIRCYDTEIRYTDESIKQLMEYLQRKGMTKKIVTCITSDHGEQHGEHGSRGGHHDFYSENTLVPLVFHGNNIPGNQVEEGFVSTMDIAVTLLSTAGLSFNQKTEGRNLLGSKRHDNNRPFLLIANPWRIKSLQLIRFPLSYILNFDRFYKYWYVSKNKIEIAPDNLFKKVKKENIKITSHKRFNRLTIYFPNQFQKGLHYAGIRIKLAGEQFMNDLGAVFNKRIKTQWRVNKKTDHVTVFHPVTSQDRNELKIIFSVPLETKLEGIEYTFLSQQEFKNHSSRMRKLGNKIYSALSTRRKNSTLDELYRLTDDMEMNKNLLRVEESGIHKDNVIDYQESLYRWFEFYFKKGKKLIGKDKKRKKLTKKQIETLKSLGYL